jgi:Flp pilus assembly protein TadD
MVTVAEAMQAGLRHQQAGRLREAERIYREVLQADPRHADALHLLGVAAGHDGRHDEAVRLIGDAIAVAPAQPLFRCSLANALTAAGRFDQALAACREALRLRPGFAEAHASLGNLSRARGRMADAEAAFREVLRLQPGNAEAHNNLGNVLRGQGRLDEAEACYRRALELRPADAVPLANIGAVLLLANRLDEAEHCLRPAVRLRPDLAPAHASLGELFLRRGRAEEAEACCRTALRLDPSCAEAQKSLAGALRLQGRLDEAEAGYRAAARLNPEDAELHAGLGRLLRERGDVPAARAAFAEAVRLGPSLFEARNDLAACLIEEGRTEEAVHQLQEVLRLRPGYVAALGNLGTLARDGLYRFRAEDAAQVRALLADPALPAEARSTLSFSLAHVLAREQAHDEAFSFYRQANDAKAALFRSRGLGFDRAKHRRLVEQAAAVGTAEFFRRAGVMGSDSELPVFIVGMPRSGTTLVEQILASHPLVHGAGELPDIPDLGTRLARSGAHGYPACLPHLDAATVRSAAEAHLRRLSALGGPAARVTDKLPANVFHLPLIRLLFPRARVIHCVRDALDVCLSCYFQDFYTLSFATDLEDIGFYYRTYERLAGHWRTADPAPMLEVSYEALVTDTEAVSRALIAFCGMTWDDRCLTFHESRRVVRTSSVAQVRQPVYRSAVGRWQSYRKHLGPLLRALGREGSHGEPGKTEGRD